MSVTAGELERVAIVTSRVACSEKFASGGLCVCSRAGGVFFWEAIIGGSGGEEEGRDD